MTATLGDVRLRIDGPKLWTLSGFDYRDAMIATPESAYGTVLNIRDVGILGSAHFLNVPGQPGKVEKELVSSVRFWVDEQRVTQIMPTMNVTGASFRMERESQIRAVEVQSSVMVRDGVLMETARLRSQEAIDLKVTYPLMYAWSPTMTDYLFGDEQGVQKRGQFLKDAGKPNEGLEKSARWMAVFDSQQGLGAVCCLVERPANAEAWLQYTDAPGVYRKLRIMSFSEQTLPAGFEGTYRAAIGFFQATPENWEGIAMSRQQELQTLAAVPATARP
ncbi:MAG: hypothetical protein SFV23_11720 [Planctomycetaceae bacterium]|nr:hypothetical protein [Planctomycetaceae bacterium]